MPNGLRFEVPVGPVTLVGERWEGDSTPVVLLHAGVADRRCWRDVAGRLDGQVIAYDRRGFGDTPPSPEPFTHLDDLVAMLDAVGATQAWLVGNSMGGALALDAALTVPERVAGLVLIAPAVGGQPDPEALDPDTTQLVGLLQAAGEARDVDELGRLEAWLWLDGPAAPEGRVGGPARALALDMNARILRNAFPRRSHSSFSDAGKDFAPEEAGESGVDAWSRLDEVHVPTTVIWGDRDVPYGIETCQTVAARVPGARTHVLHGTAHLPSLEQPDELAAAIQDGMPGR